MSRAAWRLSPAIVLGAVFLGLTRFVRHGPPVPREMRLDAELTAHAPVGLIVVSHAANVQQWVFVVLALGVCLVLARRFRQALLLLLVEPLAETVSLALKFAVNRQMPDQAVVQGWQKLDTLLFPSGHVVRTTVTLGLLILFVAWPHARLRWPASIVGLAAIALICVTQVTVGGHLPLDVIGGFLVGGMLVNLVYVVDRAWARRGRPAVEPRRSARIRVTEVMQPLQQIPLPAAHRVPPRLPGPTVARVRTTTSGRLWPAAGLAVALLVVGLGTGAPRGVRQLTAGSGSVKAWPRTLATDAAHGAASARIWATRLHAWVVSA